MYAVLVIAAILLSVGPMHARTILAALPASIPGHQFASNHQATGAEVPGATRQTERPARATNFPTARMLASEAPVAAASPRIAAPSLGLLDHAPNAP